MSGARVDVGIVTFNTAEMTASALRHLLDHDQGADLRVLVHDNASSDGTVERLASEVPEAQVEAGVENEGFAAGMNRLLARSTASWFVALNSDAWPERGAIGRLVRTAEDRPETALVVPRLERPDGTLEHSTHPFPSLGISLLLATGAHRLVPAARRELLALPGAWGHDRLRQVDWAVGAAWLLRRSVVDQVGGFDTRFFMYAEDLDWCWRARRAGWEVWFDPRATVVHVGNASGEGAYGERRTAAYLHNTDRFLRQARGPAFAALYRWINAAGCLRRALGARIRRDPDRAAHWKAAAAANVRAPSGTDRP